MSAKIPSVIEVLATVPDFRRAQGTRHPLRAILGLAVAATLCGYRSYAAMAEWGRFYDADLVRALGFTRPKTPSVGTFHAVFRGLDREAFEAALATWAAQCLAALPPRRGEPEPLALDGKSLRGSRKQGAIDVHLLSVLSQRLGLTVAQQAVDDKSNEIPAAKELLAGLLLEGRVITMDALLCQKEIAALIVEKGGTM
jgi:DDE family transposase